MRKIVVASAFLVIAAMAIGIGACNNESKGTQKPKSSSVKTKPVAASAETNMSMFGQQDMEVLIKPNPKSRDASDFFLKDMRTGKATKFVTVTDVSSDHFHAAAHHKGYIYVIRRHDGEVNANSNMSDELWRYAPNGTGTKLWSGKAMDFRVRDDEGMIAILASPKQTQESLSNSLYFLSRDGKLIKLFSPSQLGSTDIIFERWDGRFLWLVAQEEMDISKFVKIDSGSMSIKNYDLSSLHLSAMDYALNTTSLQLAYSDYPVMFDVYEFQDFKSRKTPVTLYVYDLATKQRRFIAKAVAKSFEPKWTSSSTLEYNDPQGKGRVRKSIH